MSNFIIVRYMLQVSQGEIMVQCLSSHVMTHLILWRNPCGREANWIFGGRIRLQRPPFIKVICAQFAFAALAITALVETVVFSIFAFLALPFNYIGVKKPLEFTVNLLQSASFTILWTIGNLFFNFVSPNLLTQEKFACDFIFHGGVSPNEVIRV